MDITTPPASLRALWKKVIFNCSPSIRAYDSDPSDSPGSFTCDGLTQIVPRFFPTPNPYRRSPRGAR